MCAATLKNGSILLLENNDRIGAKISVSGGGKCNITNAHLSPEYFSADPHFISPALEYFNNKALLLWLQQNGLHPKIDERVAPGQYFCKSSSQVIELFQKAISHVTLQLNTTVTEVTFQGQFLIHTNKGIFPAKNLIIASGGSSYQQLGASDIGYTIAKSFGHTVKKPSPALVGMTVQKDQFWFKDLSGISVPVSINVQGIDISGNLLFTHKGCSGPAIMNASLYWEKGPTQIDFLPTMKTAQLLQESKKQLSTILPLPKRFTLRFLQELGISDKPINKYSKEEKGRILALRHYPFAPAGVLGYAKAEVTKGGVYTDEVDPHTMQSRLHSGLYFTGEVLDVTGRLGGYNFQWAFSSAHLCAKHLSTS